MAGWNTDVLSGKKPARKKKVAVVDLGKKGSFKIHKGLLHKHLGIPEGEKIPQERLREALHSKNPDIRDEARSAIGLEHMAKK
jgi:hypothetical protein